MSHASPVLALLTLVSAWQINKFITLMLALQMCLLPLHAFLFLALLTLVSVLVLLNTYCVHIVCLALLTLVSVLVSLNTSCAGRRWPHIRATPSRQYNFVFSTEIQAPRTDRSLLGAHNLKHDEPWEQKNVEIKTTQLSGAHLNLKYNCMHSLPRIHTYTYNSTWVVHYVALWHA